MFTAGSFAHIFVAYHYPTLRCFVVGAGYVRKGLCCAGQLIFAVANFVTVKRVDGTQV